MAYLTKRTAWEAAISAVVSAVLSFIVFTPILRFIASGWSAGDMLSTYVNAEMWQGFSYRVTTQMGFPLGMDLNYFPGIDITENVFAQLVTNITGKPFVGINLLIIVTFPIVAALAYLAIRMTRLQGPIAIALAVAFSLIPYHWGRALGHTYLSTLYSAVTGMLLVLLIGSGWLPSILTTGPRRKRIWVGLALAALMLITAWTGIYYAVFTLILGVAALLWRITRGDGWRQVLLSASPLLAIVAFVVLGFLPAIMARSAVPPLAPLGERLPYQSVMFAGLLVTAILPAPVSALPFLHFYNKQIIEALSAAPPYENVMPTTFGTWVTTGALGVFLLGAIVRSRRGTSDRRLTGVTPGLIGVLIGTTIVFFVPWGLNYLFAGTVTAQIRAWDRLLPFLLLLFILGAAATLQRTRFADTDRWALPLTALILIVTATESVIPFRAAYVEAVDQASTVTAAAYTYAEQVNAALPGDCGILQLPYFAYPEHGVVEGVMHDYDHFWVSLTNPKKRWSYGSVKNTAASVWAAQLPQTPTDEDLQRLAAGGFCGLHVDLDGYDPASRDLVVWDLRHRLGSPVAENTAGHWLLFAIPHPIGPTSESSWSSDVTRFFHPPYLATDDTSLSLRYSELSESWRWLTHQATTITITPTDPRVPLAGIRGEIQSTDCYPGEVTVTFTGDGVVQSKNYTLQRASAPQPFSFRLPRTSSHSATLTIDAPGVGCLITGDPSRKYAQVRNLTPLT